jgi:hypothetical protein
LVPHAQFVELAGAAHTAAGDDNDAFTDAVCEFVKSVTAADGAPADSSAVSSERPVR